MHNLIMGWDIGGAHLKAAVIRQPAEVLAVEQAPCPLWQGIEKLNEAVRLILAQTPFRVENHVITMTGELADGFADRDDGVQQILQAMRRILPDQKITVFAGNGGILALDEIEPSHYPLIASANWLASATWAAQHIDSGVFVDVGSTTTDILLLQAGRVKAHGYTDYERLVSNEMVYLGTVRTPVMAVAQSIEDCGREVGLMAEHFATMADVYRLTGELEERHDQYPSADGAEKTPAASGRRLARMIGCDYHENEHERWRQVAFNLRERQIIRIKAACEAPIQREALPGNRVIVGAGIGRFLAREIAERLHCPYVDFADLCFRNDAKLNYSIADCAPAVAVACLAVMS